MLFKVLRFGDCVRLWAQSEIVETAYSACGYILEIERGTYAKIASCMMLLLSQQAVLLSGYNCRVCLSIGDIPGRNTPQKMRDSIVSPHALP
jgi:hypothetical protein